MTQADRIREYALRHFVEPARRVGRHAVAIQAGDVNREMVSAELLPDNRVPNVCNALESHKFLALAGLELEYRAGPPQSTTTTFLYAIR